MRSDPQAISIHGHLSFPKYCHPGSLHDKERLADLKAVAEAESSSLPFTTCFREVGGAEDDGGEGLGGQELGAPHQGGEPAGGGPGGPEVPDSGDHRGAGEAGGADGGGATWSCSSLNVWCISLSRT